MCHIIVSKHTYSECKLLDTAEPDSIPDGQPSTPASTLPQMTRLIRSFQKSITNNAQTSAEAEPPAPNLVRAKVLSEPEIHVVTQKTFLQCAAARDPDSEDSHIWDIPVNKRTCSKAKEVEFGEEAEDDDDYTFKSDLRGPCPVCEAAESAVSKSLVKIKVQPAADAQNSGGPNITQAQTEQPDVPQSHLPRKNSKHHRHRHHGTRRGQREAERAVRTGGGNERGRASESNENNAARVKTNNGERPRRPKKKKRGLFHMLFGIE